MFGIIFYCLVANIVGYFIAANFVEMQPITFIFLISYQNLT